MNEAYNLKAVQTEREVLKLRQNNPPWQHCKTIKNLEMYFKPSPHFNGNMYKFIMELDFPHYLVYEVMSPPQNAKEKLAWDKSLKDYERLITISQELAVGLIVTPPAAFGMISKREFIDLQLFKTYPNDDMNDGYGEICWIFGQSVDFPARSPAKDCVRGRNYPGGYAVAQNKRNPAKCFVELYVNTDVGGSLPRSVIERALPYQQISYLDCLKAEVKKRLSRSA